MRKVDRKKALELVETLQQMHTEIKKQITQKNIVQALGLLAECQEAAIQLGNFIEGAEGEGFVTIGYIERYCESLYREYEALQGNSGDGTINADVIYDNLCGQAVKIENSIKNDIKEHIEMVFLPYKASMWDSLESVWQAAEEDPECDAYVIPIPYFEKNDKGELAVEHYEGDQLPKNVPITFYKYYSMEERRPDVVFIHNPYDEYNHVTSIHPAYYIFELKKYAKKVAYIPYYVSAEVQPDSPEVQQQKTGFVVMPGVIYSDMVFVQSENTKRLYVNILEKSVSGVGRDYWENRIFGLGSPKLDRVHNVKRDDSRLSDQWRNLIYDKQGNRKKVVLYNTSLSDLLNQADMMNKIKDTISFFEGQEDCVLWWRPHPLYESTLSSMRPDLLEVYRKIVREYKAGAKGIFDEGEDLEWALAETDVYYGDGSSVAQLYLEAGKPVLYQDVRVKNSVDIELDIPIWPSAFCEEKDNIWFVHGKINLLMVFRKSTKKIEIVGTVPDEISFQESLYQTMYKDGNAIYLIPCYAREIAIYDLVDKNFTKIQLNNVDDYVGKPLFSKCFAVEKTLYCVPHYYGAIIAINLMTRKIDYYDLKYLLDEGQDILLGDAVLIDKTIVSCWNISNQLLFFDVNKKKINLVSIGNKDEQYMKIARINKNLVLYDVLAKQISIISMSDKRQITVNRKFENFWMSVIADVYVVIDLVYKNTLICLDELGNVIEEKIQQTKPKAMALEHSYYAGMVAADYNRYMYFDLVAYILYIMDGSNLVEEYDFKHSKISIDEIERVLPETIPELVRENEVLTLQKWIFYFQNEKTNEKKLIKSSGRVIENTVKRIMKETKNK